MPSLRSFKLLDPETRRAITDRVVLRKRQFVAGKSSGNILLVGDRPAPSAPDDPTFHYTPFGALWNSSLWLNLLLHRANIPEQELSWVNAADFHGRPTDKQILNAKWQLIIALGGSAAKWIKPTGITFEQVQHPAAWKRFHSKEEYPLIQLLHSHLIPILGTAGCTNE